MKVTNQIKVLNSLRRDPSHGGGTPLNQSYQKREQHQLKQTAMQIRMQMCNVTKWKTMDCTLLYANNRAAQHCGWWVIEIMIWTGWFLGVRECKWTWWFFFQTCDKTRYGKSFEKQSTCDRRKRGHVDESEERWRVEICVSVIEQLLLSSLDWNSRIVKPPSGDFSIKN